MNKEELRDKIVRGRKIVGAVLTGQNNSPEYYEGKLSAIKTILNLIDQLDEPEVLSQEWIDENIVYADVKGNTEAFLNEHSVRNLLVPKQEECVSETGKLKPVIPQFVAEWIEDLKSNGISLITHIYDFTHDDKLEEYIHANGDTLMRAWLHGYTVEKEKKYRVKDGKDLLLTKIDGKVVSAIKYFVCSSESVVDSELTEQEIKDYDERYWPFAVPVEEEEY